MSKYEKGKVIKGRVTCVEPYGAFVSFDDSYTGLIHISEISRGFVNNICDFVNVGELIYAEVLEVDEIKAHLKLSIKNIQYRVNGAPKRRKVIETESGFKTLAEKLPVWTAEKLKSIKNEKNSIDK